MLGVSPLGSVTGLCVFGSSQWRLFPKMMLSTLLTWNKPIANQCPFMYVFPLSIFFHFYLNKRSWVGTPAILEILDLPLLCTCRSSIKCMEHPYSLWKIWLIGCQCSLSECRTLLRIIMDRPRFPSSKIAYVCVHGQESATHSHWIDLFL